MLKTVATAVQIKLARGEKKKALIGNRLEVYRAANLASFVGRWLGLPLDRILKLAGTDKQASYGHRYAPHYAMFFRPLRFRRITLLEIGIGGYKENVGGQSINAWRWFFPFAKIVACDIEDRSALTGPGITIRRLDQSKSAELEAVAKENGPFDIIIDDGSHVNEHQILTFKTLFKHLNDKGVYVVEDIQTSYWRYMGGDSLDGNIETCMKFFTRMTHYLNACEFEAGIGDDAELRGFADQIATISFHHNLIIIEKDVTPKVSNMLVGGGS